MSGDTLTTEQAQSLAERWADALSGPEREAKIAAWLTLDEDREQLFAWVRARMVEQRVWAFDCPGCGSVWTVESEGPKNEDEIGGGECLECGDTLPPVGRDEPQRDRETLAHDVMTALRLPPEPHGEHGTAWTLCESSGWPS